MVCILYLNFIVFLRLLIIFLFGNYVLWFWLVWNCFYWCCCWCWCLILMGWYWIYVNDYYSLLWEYGVFMDFSMCCCMIYYVVIWCVLGFCFVGKWGRMWGCCSWIWGLGVCFVVWFFFVWWWGGKWWG